MYKAVKSITPALTKMAEGCQKNFEFTYFLKPFRELMLLGK